MKAKYQLIKLEDYNIIVSDEEIKDRDWFYNIKSQNIFYNDSDKSVPKGETEFPLIASDNPEHGYGDEFGGWYPLPSIDYNGFEEELGIVENPIKSFGRFILQITNRVIKKNSKLTPLDNKTGEELLDDLFNDWLKTQSFNDKKFSLEDIKKAIDIAFEKGKNRIGFYESDYSQIIQSLQQPKVFDIEVEMEVFTETVGTCEFDFSEQDSKRPKITNNQIKIIKTLP